MKFPFTTVSHLVRWFSLMIGGKENEEGDVDANDDDENR